MLDSLFGNSSFTAMTEALNASTLRQQVIANNLANVNTPGYKRQSVQFESALDAALKQRQGGIYAVPQQSLSAIKPTVVTDNSTSMRTDGNNVDPEVENADLAINTIKYETLVQSVTNYFQDLKTAVLGR